MRFFLGKRFYQCLEKPKAEWRNFPHLRWAIVRKLFSWRFTYWLFGLRDPAFLSENAELRAIPEAMQECLHRDQVQTSCLFHLVMNGHLRAMLPANLPPSFQPEVLMRVKKALASNGLQLHYVLGDVRDTLHALPFQKPGYCFFSLSDLSSFLPWNEMEALLQQISGIGANSRVVFRTFVRNRLQTSPSQPLPSVRGQKLQDLSAAERTRFYQVFQIDFRHENA